MAPSRTPPTNAANASVPNPWVTEAAVKLGCPRRCCTMADLIQTKGEGVDTIPNTTAPERSSSGRAADREGGGSVAAVVERVREGLRAHDIRAADVVGTVVGENSVTVDVVGVPLGDAAVLALVLNEAVARESSGDG